MTREQLDAVWIRWMHRNDIEEDLDDIYLFASHAATNFMMFVPEPPQTVVDELMEFSPQVMVHAGLMYLAELAQDDVQLERETMKFQTTARDWQLARSIQIPAPQMNPPYVATPSNGRAT